MLSNHIYIYIYIYIYIIDINTIYLYHVLELWYPKSIRYHIMIIVKNMRSRAYGVSCLLYGSYREVNIALRRDKTIEKIIVKIRDK